jgi:hypothetical protein
MHEDVAKPLRNILERPTELSALTRMSAIMKRSNFMFTLFHIYSLAESSMALLNPAKGMRVNYNILRKSVFTRGPEWSTGDALSHLVQPESYREAFVQASEAGVKLGAPTHDVMKDQFETIIGGVAAKLDAKAKGHQAKWAAKKLFEFQGWFDTATWAKYHTPMKVIAFDNVYHNLKGIRDGTAGMTRLIPDKLRWSKKSLQGMSDEQLARSVASFVNDEFGGQAFELATKGWVENWLSKPSNLKTINFVFTSLDWNVSALKAGLSFMQAMPVGRHSNPARGILGLRHWRNAMMGWAFYGNMMNKVMSGHFMWENEPGRKLFHIDTGERDKDGRPGYWHIGKQFRELPTSMGVEPRLQAGGRFGRRPGMHGIKPFADMGLTPVVEFTKRKIMPWIQVPFQIAMDAYMLESQYIREGKELGLDDRVLDAMSKVFRSAAPFSLSSPLNPALEDFSPGQKLKLGAVGTMLPTSKGLSRGQLVAEMTEAIRAGDYARFDQITLDLVQTRGMETVKEMADEARDMAQRYPQSGELKPDSPYDPTAPQSTGPLKRLRQYLREN